MSIVKKAKKLPVASRPIIIINRPFGSLDFTDICYLSTSKDAKLREEGESEYKIIIVDNFIEIIHN